VLLLGLIAALGLARGTYWILVTPVWNPIDETAHYAYAQSIATGGGVPTVGHDRVETVVLEIAKTSPTYYFRSEPYQATPGDNFWGGTAQQYEAVQGPIYYALLAPAYWLGRPFGVLASVYALRFASVLLALTAVPLTYLLARELFPRQRRIWLLAPLVLVVIQGFNANLASVSNDALVVPSAAAALLLLLRARHSFTAGSAVLAGLALGVAVVNKTTVLGLIPLAGLFLLGLVVTGRRSLSAIVRWGAIYGAAGSVILAPWLLWNFHAYGAISPGARIAAITGVSQMRVPLTLDGLRTHWLGAGYGLWDFQLMSLGRRAYGYVFETALVAALALGGITAWRRRMPDTAWKLAWLAAALPMAFLCMLGIIYTATGGAGSPAGRHLYLALAPVAVLLAAGAVIGAGARWGTVAVLAVVAAAMVFEAPVVDHHLEASYGTGLLAGGQAPVVDQSWTDEWVTVRSIDARPPCPLTAVGVAGPQPVKTISVRAGSTTVPGRFVTSDRVFHLYALDTTVRADKVSIELPAGARVGRSRLVRSRAVAFTELPGSPAARLYCRVGDPEEVRFRELFPPQHLSGATLDRLRLWPRLWQVLALVGVAISVVVSVRARRGRGAAPG
jgi:hypothetical protein